MPKAHQHKLLSAEAAARLVRPGNRVFVGTTPATPRTLLAALEAMDQPAADVELVHFLVQGAVALDAYFAHRLYQFALAYSRWRHVSVIDSCESFLALSTGLQAALWALGGVPEEHRTDSLSAAFNNLAEQEELTKRHSILLNRSPSHVSTLFAWTPAFQISPLRDRVWFMDRLLWSSSEVAVPSSEQSTKNYPKMDL